MSVYVDYINSLGMSFRFIPAGTFTMGSPADELGRNPEDETQHEVTLTRPFYMQPTEVTQSQWFAVMGSNSSYFSDCSECPVEQVSWNDVQDFIETLNLLESGVADSPYRLPTEAEWEYSCRAGTTTAFANGVITNNDCELDPNLNEIGWYCYNGWNETHRVAKKAPNAWGLYDMHGNVFEWCSDWYSSDLGTSGVTDPIGPSIGSNRVVRGGGWRGDAQSCRSANRIGCSPTTSGSLLVGFRLVRVE